MPMRLLLMLFPFFLSACDAGPETDPQVEAAPVRVTQWTDYEGWEAIVLENDLITMAVVPVIGARIMAYALDGHESMFVNAAERGKVYPPGTANGWPNYGGFKNWPAPQDRWGWPPPPWLDHGPYAAEVTRDDGGAASVFVAGPTAQSGTPGLRFERTMTLYRGTTRLTVRQSLINDGTERASWSIWDITQNLVQHGALRDSENFWVYFPVEPGAAGVRTTKPSEAWKGEVAPGIYGVQFHPADAKLFARVSDGWICYVDERDGYTFCKTFALDAAATYPDGDAHVAVWLSGKEPYLEVEVMSPLYDLAPGGGSASFTEEWWATHVDGPIVAVSPAGAVRDRLAHDGRMLSGTFGVFHRGTAAVHFLDASGTLLDTGDTHVVTPAEPFVLREAVALPPGTARIELHILGWDGEEAGILDAVDA